MFAHELLRRWSILPKLLRIIEKQGIGYCIICEIECPFSLDTIQQDKMTAFRILYDSQASIRQFARCVERYVSVLTSAGIIKRTSYKR